MSSRVDPFALFDAGAAKCLNFEQGLRSHFDTLQGRRASQSRWRAGNSGQGGSGNIVGGAVCIGAVNSLDEARHRRSTGSESTLPSLRLVADCLMNLPYCGMACGRCRASDVPVDNGALLLGDRNYRFWPMTVGGHDLPVSRLG